MAEYSRVLGETVKGARLSLKLTQKRVAEQINVDERTILNIEYRKRDFEPDTGCPLPLVSGAQD